MSQDPLDYQLLIQDALRGLVRRSLEIVAEQGFTGDHHFYITFSTGAPGVVMPHHLRDSYPEEMTIVLKTQFQDLTVDAEMFSVGLFFSGVLYYLTVPFAAVIRFVDPSASFGLDFEQQAADDQEEAPEADAAEASAAPAESEEGVGDADNVVAFSLRKK